VFASKVSDSVSSALAATPVAARAHELGQAISSGAARQAIAGSPAGARRAVAQAANQGFVDGLNLILLIGALVAFAAAASSLALIRQRDIVAEPAAAAGPSGEPAAAAVV
jgi:hypothetical protein